ncbi:MAG: Hsp70 family protein, partial [Calditrichia bacterium]|nr:Hsp70 family protein [Calditrichia bacterium]
LQGERPMAADNMTLGRFRLEGIPPASRGIPQVEVTFDIDANGILNVNAKDKATNKEQNIRIEASSGLNEDEVEKMRKDAQSHAAEDAKRKEEVDIRNQVDTTIYQTEKQMTEMGDKLDADAKSKVETALGRLKEAQKGSNIDEMKSALDQLNKEWNDAASKMYAQASPEQGGPQAQGAPEGEPAPDSAKKEEAQDADFEVVDEKEEKKK